MVFIITVLWVGVVAWVANDAARRHRQWFGWATMVWFTNVIGLPVWLIVRRSSPVVGEQPTLRRRMLVGAVATIPFVLLFFIFGPLLSATFFLQSGRVAGNAMEPTLKDQGQVLINKFVYRRSDPRPGDVVMMYYPLDPAKAFIERVIAQPGDTIHIIDGRVFINDKPLKDDYVLPQFRGHDDWGPQVIPEGYYFVLGDHRNNSSDSRHWGYVPKKYIIGKVVARFGVNGVFIHSF
jgi:signal peptidase I